MVRVGLLLLLSSGVSGCAFFGGGDAAVSSPSSLSALSVAQLPEVASFQVSLIEQDHLSANILLISNQILEEDVWVYLRIFSGDLDGDIFKVLVLAGYQGREISFSKEAFLLIPAVVQVHPCQDGCYTPSGEPVSLF